MERDFILGYLALKGASLLAMYLHQRPDLWSAPLDVALVPVAVAGFGLGFWRMAAAWKSARNAAKWP
jgi:hypothetical protein